MYVHIRTSVHMYACMCVHVCAHGLKRLQENYLFPYSWPKYRANSQLKKKKQKLPRILPMFSNTKARCLQRLSVKTIFTFRTASCQWRSFTNISQKKSTVWQYLFSHILLKKG